MTRTTGPDFAAINTHRHTHKQTRVRNKYHWSFFGIKRTIASSMCVLWTHQPGSHRRKVAQDFSTSFCGACLNFSREKDSDVTFPRRQ